MVERRVIGDKLVLRLRIVDFKLQNSDCFVMRISVGKVVTVSLVAQNQPVSLSLVPRLPSAREELLRDDL